MITYDRSARTVLAICSCGWRQLALSDEAARRAGVDHEDRAHTGRNQSRQLVMLAARRRVAASNVGPRADPEVRGIP